MDGAFTSRPVDPETADAYFEKLASYEADRLASMQRQRNLALGGMSICAAAVGAMALAVAALAGMQKEVPMVFVEDKVTGLVTRNTDLAGDTLTEVEALNRAFAKQYVENREGYTADEVSVRNRRVAAFSAQDEYARYAAQQHAPSGAPQLFGRHATVRVMVRAIHQLTDAKDAKRGVMEVTLDRAVVDAGDDVTPFWSDTQGCLRVNAKCQHLSVKLDFERLGSKLPESLRNDNPLGWLVTQYESVGEGA
jgi:type IV secretory pathway component VirB8